LAIQRARFWIGVTAGRFAVSCPFIRDSGRGPRLGLPRIAAGATTVSASRMSGRRRDVVRRFRCYPRGLLGAPSARSAAFAFYIAIKLLIQRTARAAAVAVATNLCAVLRIVVTADVDARPSAATLPAVTRLAASKFRVESADL